MSALRLAPTPLDRSKIAEALGLEGKALTSLTIDLRNGRISRVDAGFLLTSDQEDRLAVILKDYYLCERGWA